MRRQNLNSLGTEYNVINDSGKLIKVIKIIDQQQILMAAIGTFSDNMHMSISEYLDASNEKLCGFAPGTNNIFWFKSTEHDFDIMDVIDSCIVEGYDYAIVEVVTE